MKPGQRRALVTGQARYEGATQARRDCPRTPCHSATWPLDEFPDTESAAVQVALRSPGTGAPQASYRCYVLPLFMLVLLDDCKTRSLRADRGSARSMRPEEVRIGPDRSEDQLASLPQPCRCVKPAVLRLDQLPGKLPILFSIRCRSIRCRALRTRVATPHRPSCAQSLFFSLAARRVSTSASARLFFASHALILL